MVDILLSTYNGNKYLEEQLDSILAQDYKDIRIIVRDDKSTDDTPSILKKYENLYPEKFRIILSDINLGTKNSFFELAKLSSAEYIMFSDQDDFWFSDKISSCLEYIKNIEGNTKEPSLIYTELVPTDDKLKPIGECVHSKLTNIDYNSLNKTLFSSKATGMSIMFNRSLLRKTIMPNDKRIIMHDHWFELTASIFGNKCYFNKKTAYYRQHLNNVAGYRPKKGLNYFISGIKMGKIFISKMKNSAQCLLEYYPNMAPEQKIIISNFVNLNKFNIIKRIFILKKYKYSDGVPTHYLALLFF